MGTGQHNQITHPRCPVIDVDESIRFADGIGTIRAIVCRDDNASKAAQELMGNPFQHEHGFIMHAAGDGKMHLGSFSMMRALEITRHWQECMGCLLQTTSL
jgi:hypothetical protein